MNKVDRYNRGILLKEESELIESVEILKPEELQSFLVFYEKNSEDL